MAKIIITVLFLLGTILNGQQQQQQQVSAELLDWNDNLELNITEETLLVEDLTSTTHTEFLINIIDLLETSNFIIEEEIDFNVLYMLKSENINKTIFIDKLMLQDIFKPEKAKDRLAVFMDAYVVVLETIKNDFQGLDED